MSEVKTVLELHNLFKSYGPIKALHNVSLQFAETGIYGVFGRYGASKSTLLDIVSSRLFADQGYMKIEVVVQHRDSWYVLYGSKILILPRAVGW